MKINMHRIMITCAGAAALSIPTLATAGERPNLWLDQQIRLTQANAQRPAAIRATAVRANTRVDARPAASPPRDARQTTPTPRARERTKILMK